MATKIFEVAEMACEDVQAWVRSAKYGSGTDANFTAATCDDGAFVTLGGLCADTVYTNEKDWNCKYAYAPASADLEVGDIYVTDISGVENGVIGGVNYRMGIKQVDLQVAAGYPVRVRKVQKGDMFWIGAGDFVSTPTVGQYATLTANDVRLTPAAAAGSHFAVAIRASKAMTLGTKVAQIAGAYEQEYLVEVI